MLLFFLLYFLWMLVSVLDWFACSGVGVVSLSLFIVIIFLD